MCVCGRGHPHSASHCQPQRPHSEARPLGLRYPKASEKSLSSRYTAIKTGAGAYPSVVGATAVDWQAMTGGAAVFGAPIPDPGNNGLGQQPVTGKIDEQELLAEQIGLRVLL